MTLKASIHGIPITEGDIITSFRGEYWDFVKVTRPATPGRSAKVLVRDIDGTMEFYVQVFPGLEITEED